MSDQSTTCPYNSEVVCGSRDWRNRVMERNCDACGWNPEVAKARLEKLSTATKDKKSQENN